MKFFIHNTKIFLEQNISFSNRSKWGFLKYEIRKKCVSFPKVLAQNLANNMLSWSKILIVKKNLKNMTKQGANLKKYMIKLQVLKFVVNVLGIKMAKNLENVSMSYKKNAICGTIKTLVND